MENRLNPKTPPDKLAEEMKASGVPEEVVKAALGAVMQGMTAMIAPAALADLFKHYPAEMVVDIFEELKKLTDKLETCPIQAGVRVEVNSVASEIQCAEENVYLMLYTGALMALLLSRKFGEYARAQGWSEEKIKCMFDATQRLAGLMLKDDGVTKTYRFTQTNGEKA